MPTKTATVTAAAKDVALEMQKQVALLEGTPPSVMVPIRMSKPQHAFLKEVSRLETRTLQAILMRAINEQYPDFIDL